MTFIVRYAKQDEPEQLPFLDGESPAEIADKSSASLSPDPTSQQINNFGEPNSSFLSFFDDENPKTTLDSGDALSGTVKASSFLDVPSAAQHDGTFHPESTSHVDSLIKFLDSALKNVKLDPGLSKVSGKDNLDLFGTNNVGGTSFSSGASAASSSQNLGEILGNNPNSVFSGVSPEQLAKEFGQVLSRHQAALHEPHPVLGHDGHHHTSHFMDIANAGSVDAEIHKPFPTDIDQVVTAGIGSLFRGAFGGLSSLTAPPAAAAGAAGGKALVLSGPAKFVMTGVYFAKTGFLLLGAMCSKLFGMGLIGFMAFQSLSAPSTELPPLRADHIDLTRSIAFYRLQDAEEIRERKMSGIELSADTEMPIIKEEDEELGCSSDEPSEEDFEPSESGSQSSREEEERSKQDATEESPKLRHGGKTWRWKVFPTNEEDKESAA